MAKIISRSIILNPNTRQAIIPQRRGGLNAAGQAKGRAVALRNPLARQKG
jgi:hypothetical protein